MSKFLRMVPAACMLLGLSVATAAQDAAGGEGRRNWSVGLLGLTYHSPFEAEKDSYNIIPYLSYRGDHLYLEGLEAGYSFIAPPEEGEVGLSFDVIAAGRALPGSSRDRITLDAGVRVGLHGPFGDLSVTGLRDVSDVSNGYEAWADYSYTFSGEKWFVTPRVGVVWQDARMANFMWGVSQSQHDKMVEKAKDVILPVYLPDEDVINYDASLMAGYRVTDRWSVISFISGTYLDKKVRAHPGIDKKADFTFGLGASYAF